MVIMLHLISTGINRNVVDLGPFEDAFERLDLRASKRIPVSILL